MNITLYTDGGSLNNPGQAACAFVIYADDNIIEQTGIPLGIASNNFAEYSGLQKALERVKELIANGTLSNVQKVFCYADSELMVKQLNGLYKVKNADIREKVMAIRILESEIKIPITYTHVLREKNALADSLVKKALGR